MVWIRLLFYGLIFASLCLGGLGVWTGQPRYWQMLKQCWKIGLGLALCVLVFFFLSRLFRF